VRAASSLGCTPVSWTGNPEVDRRRRAVETTRLFARSVAYVDRRRWLRSSAPPAQARPAGSALGEELRLVVSARARNASTACLYTETAGVNLRPSDARSRVTFLHRAGWSKAISRRGRHFSPTTPAHRRDRAPRAQVAPAGHLVDRSCTRRSTTSAYPGHISSPDFEKWRKDASASCKLLYFQPTDLDVVRHQRPDHQDNFPPVCCQLGLPVCSRVTRSEPVRPRDGRSTDDVPLALLTECGRRCEWLVPGLSRRRIRAMAKSIRSAAHKLGSLDEFAAMSARRSRLRPPLAAALARHSARRSLDVPAGFFRPIQRRRTAYELPAVDDSGRQLAWSAIWRS